MSHADGAAVRRVLETIESATDHDGVLVVAVDGRSGTGKSTLAAAVAESLASCLVIDGDDFYAGGRPDEWDARSAAEKVDLCIDWRRQRALLTDLRAGRPAEWYPFDWDAFDDRLAATPITADPADVVILEGAYSARPELADVIDLRVLLEATEAERHRRLYAREGEQYHDEWFARWDEAEQHYFESINPASAFDLVIGEPASA